MKQSFKDYFKLGILLLGISLTLVNCQKDDELSSHEKENLSQQPITAVRIYKDKIQSNDRIVAKINEIISIKKQRKTLSKSILDEVSGIEIETDYAILYTDTTRDYDYHSYTFPVTNTPLEAGLENILISLQPDGSYKEYLIHYDVSEWEIEMIYNKEFVDLEGKTNYIQLENGTFSQNAFEKIYFEDDCWYESTEIAGEPCIVDGHLYGDSRCELIGYYGEATEGFTHTALITCNNSGGGGSTGEGPTGGSNTTGGTNNTPTDDSIVVVSCNSRDILCIEDICAPLSLSNQVAISSYLSANNNSPEAVAFVEEAENAFCTGGDVDFEEQIIYDNTWNNYPCQREIVKDALESCSPITEELLNIFQANDYSNLSFSISNIITGNGLTEPQSIYNPNTSTCTTMINFRKDYVQGTTDISLARTVIHESVHAILVYLFESGDLISPNGQPLSGYENLVNAHINYSLGLPANLGKTHHELLAEYVYKIAVALEAYSIAAGHTNNDYEFYTKLAWQGLFTTSAFQSLYPKYLDPEDAINNPTNYNIEWLDIIATNEVEQDNTTYLYNHSNGTTYTYTRKGNTPNVTVPCN